MIDHDQTSAQLADALLVGLRRQVLGPDQIDAWRSLIAAAATDEARLIPLLRVMIGVRHPRAREEFLRFAEHPNPAVRCVAVRGLGLQDDAIDRLLTASRDEAPEVRIEAIAALTTLDDPRARTGVADMYLGDEDAAIRRRAGLVDAMVGEHPAEQRSLVRAFREQLREWGGLFEGVRRPRVFGLLAEFLESLRERSQPTLEALLRRPRRATLGGGRGPGGAAATTLQVRYLGPPPPPSKASDDWFVEKIDCAKFDHDIESGVLNLELTLPVEWIEHGIAAGVLLADMGHGRKAPSSKLEVETTKTGKTIVKGTIEQGLPAQLAPEHCQLRLLSQAAMLALL